MEIAKLVLEFIKVFLSAHMVISFLTIIFICTFRKEIAGLITRVLLIKFPGGGELSMSQSQKSSVESSIKKDPPSVPAPSDLPSGLHLTVEQVKTIQELIQSERVNAYLWEYRYLNFFLVRGTQYVLDWLATLQQRPNLRLYDNIWSPIISNPVERQAILNALQQHHLINIMDDLIEVTDKGREYLGWRGPMPALPN